MRVQVTRRFLLGEGVNRYFEVGEILEGEGARIAMSLDAGVILTDPLPGEGSAAPVELPDDVEPTQDQPPST